MLLEKDRVQTAVAVRLVGDLCEMGTMCAVPEGVRCVRCGAVVGGCGRGLEYVEEKRILGW